MIRPLNDRENDLDFHFHNDLRGDRTMGHSLKRSLAVMLVCVFAIQPLAFAGIGNETTMYVGGTENQIKEGTEGKSSEKSETTFRFTYQHGELVIPYDQINDLEYG